jgi:membrane fusion protein (multidrug efflux system)
MKWQWLRQVGWWLAGVSIVVATVGGLAAIAYIKYRQVEEAMAAPPPPEVPVAVGLAQARPVTFQRTSVVVGTVLAPRFIQLRTELAGLVTTVSLEPGRTVQAGDVLVQLDTRSETAELKSATAALQLARAELTRLQSIAGSNAVSAQEADVAEANVVRAEAEVDRLTVLIDRKTIRAPFAARVGLHQLHVGQYLDAGSEITTLEGIDDYFDLDFSVPKHISQTMQVGQTVALNIGLMADGVTPQILPVPIVAMDARADAVSRTMMIRARIQDPPATMRPNDSVRVRVAYGEPIEAIQVPATAIRNAPDGASVFVAESRDGELRAVSRRVLLAGGGDGTSAWIAAGVLADEQVVAEGSFKLREGSLLAPVEIVRSGPIEPTPVSRETPALPQSETVEQP